MLLDSYSHLSISKKTQTIHVTVRTQTVSRIVNLFKIRLLQQSVHRSPSVSSTKNDKATKILCQLCKR